MKPAAPHDPPGIGRRPPLSPTALRILACVAALALVAFVSTTQQVANDVWLQAKVGEIILRDHAIPATVLFPFTEINSAGFHAHEWLASLLFHQILSTWGEAALPLVGTLIGCLLFGLTARLYYRNSQGDLALALALALMAMAAENYRHVLRPELLSLLLFVLCLDALSTVRNGMRFGPVLRYLAGTLVWANVHGSFVLSPALAMIFAIGAMLDARAGARSPRSGAPARAFLLLGALGFGCTLVTPFGLEQWRFVVDFSTTSMAKQDIIEWMPSFDPRIRSIRGIWIGLAVMTLTLALLWHRRHAVGHAQMLLLLCFLLLGTRASRFLVYVGIVGGYVLSLLWRAPSPWAVGRVLGLVLALCGLVALFGNANGNYPHSPPDQTQLSPTMARLVSDPSLQGNVLVSYGLGAELVYRAYPRLRPSIDSRLDSYGDAYYYRHEALLREHVLLDAFVQRYRVDYLLVDLADLQVLQARRVLDPGAWRLCLMDTKAALYQRAAPFGPAPATCL